MAKAKGVAVPKQTGLTVYEEQMAEEAEQAAASERPSVANISLRGGVMTYQQQVIKDNTMKCVVLASVHENRFYADRFDPDTPTSPVCFSLSTTGDEMVPHDLSLEKQHETCAGCPRAEWGSSLQGTRGKACGEVRRLALLPLAALEDPDTIKESEVAVLKVPVTSVKNWGNYVNNIRNMYRRPPYGVITEIKLVPDPKTQIKVIFAAQGLVQGDQLLGALRDRKVTLDNLLMQPYEQQAEAEQPAQVKKKVGKKKY